jgi:hypothetical protein
MIKRYAVDMPFGCFLFNAEDQRSTDSHVTPFRVDSNVVDVETSHRLRQGISSPLGVLSPNVPKRSVRLFSNEDDVDRPGQKITEKWFRQLRDNRTEVVWLSCHVYLLDMLIELGNQPNIGGFGCTDMKRLHVNRGYDLNVAEPRLKVSGDSICAAWWHPVPANGATLRRRVDELMGTPGPREARQERLDLIPTRADFRLHTQV